MEYFDIDMMINNPTNNNLKCITQAADLDSVTHKPT